MDSKTASQILILLIAALGLISIYGIILPRQLVSWVSDFWKIKSTLYISVAVRLALGLLLILSAPVSEYSTAFNYLGYFTIAAAITLVVIGRRKIGILLVWVKTWSQNRMRAMLLISLVFYGFIISGLL
jgi:hypothetical protein